MWMQFLECFLLLVTCTIENLFQILLSEMEFFRAYWKDLDQYFDWLRLNDQFFKKSIDHTLVTTRKSLHFAFQKWSRNGSIFFIRRPEIYQRNHLRLNVIVIKFFTWKMNQRFWNVEIDAVHENCFASTRT